jgi:hypothetical protein
VRKTLLLLLVRKGSLDAAENHEGEEKIEAD